MLRVGLLTSGGDAPGMNACVKSIVNCAHKKGIEIIGIRRGYQGLIEKDYAAMNNDEVDNIQHIGGTVLKTARSAEFMTESGFQKALDNIKELALDALIVIGGDGSFRGANELSKHGVNVVCVPATIDNDLSYTSRTLGFDTAVNNASFAVDSVMDTMRSHNRIAVVEVMGRHCGDIALFCAAASNAEIVVLHESALTYDQILNKVQKQLEDGNDHPTIVLAENLMDISMLTKKLAEDTGKEVKKCVLGYTQRGGKPTVADKILGLQYGVRALKEIMEGRFGIAIGVLGDNTVTLPIMDALNAPSNFNYELFDLFVTKNN